MLEKSSRMFKGAESLHSLHLAPASDMHVTVLSIKSRTLGKACLNAISHLEWEFIMLFQNRLVAQRHSVSMKWSQYGLNLQ